jgi:CRISPR system Cascade subunit CasD
VTLDDPEGDDLVADLPRSFDPRSRSFDTRRVAHTWVRPPSSGEAPAGDDHDPFALLGW